MARILGLMTDLPYFPGKNGHDHFNFRYLAQANEVGIVAPCYDWFPAQGVQNLEKFLSGGCFFWPRAASPVALFVSDEIAGALPGWAHRIPLRLRERMLERLMRIQGKPADALE